MQIEVRKADMGKEKKRLKVCAYARVSTEASEQENSLENQVSHYTEMIQSNPAYEFAGVYADFGISGFKESRPQFQKMMQDAKNGKIDLIITKSVSRFARNTAIVLKASRELKERNVGIFLNYKTSIHLRKRENCCLPYWLHLHKQKVNLQVRVPRWLIYTALRMAKS